MSDPHGHSLVHENLESTCYGAAQAAAYYHSSLHYVLFYLIGV